jgi:formyl-CoA transferase
LDSEQPLFTKEISLAGENVNQLLAGVRVLDLTRVVAGPYCTMVLGDLGAEVIKVEAPGRGDDTRHWGPPFTAGQSAYFLCVNRNKRSLTLNLKTEQGLEILKTLLRQADVLVENFRVDTLAEWGLTYEALQRLRPGLIYCTITGYGYTGPYRHRAGYDFAIQAEGGLMSITGPPDGEPYKVGIAIADISAGLYAANAILASLYARERTGSGQRIDISLLDSQVAGLTYAASSYLVAGQTPERYGNAHPNIVPYQVFKARDRSFVLAVGNDSQWHKFCQAMGRPDWAEDERFATNAARVKNRASVAAMLAAFFAERDLKEWLVELEKIGIPAAPINTIDQVFADPQVQARGLRIEVDHPTIGTLAMVGSPLNIQTAPPQVRYPPPLLGQHTGDILREMLAYDELTLNRLHQEGVI